MAKYGIRQHTCRNKLTQKHNFTEYLLITTDIWRKYSDRETKRSSTEMFHGNGEWHTYSTLRKSTDSTVLNKTKLSKETVCYTWNTLIKLKAVSEGDPSPLLLSKKRSLHSVRRWNALWSSGTHRNRHCIKNQKATTIKQLANTISLQLNILWNKKITEGVIPYWNTKRSLQ